MGGGSQKQKSQQTQTTSLPANQQRNVDTLLAGALDYFNSGGREFFPGSTVAQFDPSQTEGQGQLLNFASGTGQDLVNRAISGNDFFLDPENIMDPNRIPGFQGSVDDLTRGYTQNLTENVLPAVRGGATAAGQFGGSASGIGQALTAERSNQGLSDSLANMYMGAYGQGLDMFNQAQNRAPGLFALGAAPGRLTSSVGDVRQAQDQRNIGEDVARHNFGQNEPIVLLNLLKQLTGSSGEYGGTVESQGESRTTTSSSPLQALGGLLSLATMLPTGGASGAASAAAKGGAEAAGATLQGP